MDFFTKFLSVKWKFFSVLNYEILCCLCILSTPGKCTYENSMKILWKSMKIFSFLLHFCNIFFIKNVNFFIKWKRFQSEFIRCSRGFLFVDCLCFKTVSLSFIPLYYIYNNPIKIIAKLLIYYCFIIFMGV